MFLISSSWYLLSPSALSFFNQVIVLSIFCLAKSPIRPLPTKKESARSSVIFAPKDFCGFSSSLKTLLFRLLLLNKLYYN